MAIADIFCVDFLDKKLTTYSSVDLKSFKVK